MEAVLAILTVLGLLLAVLALPWLRRPVERLIRRIRERMVVGRALQDSLPAVRSIRDGLRSRASSDFMMCEWSHRVEVDRDGNTETTIDCLLVNITDVEQGSITFPVYFDSPEPKLAAWAKIGRSPLHLDLDQWDQSTGNGLVAVRFPAPLKPREHVRLRWGYRNRNSFSDGAEWWEWFIGRPHAMFKVVLSFDTEWSVNALRGSVVPSDHQPNAPKLRKNTILWTVPAPVPGSKYRIDFVLAENPNGSG